MVARTWQGGSEMPIVAETCSALRAQFVGWQTVSYFNIGEKTQYWLQFSRHTLYESHSRFVTDRRHNHVHGIVCGKKDGPDGQYLKALNVALEIF